MNHPEIHLFFKIALKINFGCVNKLKSNTAKAH